MRVTADGVGRARPDSRLNPTKEAAMTILQTTSCPSVFDAGLPVIAYDHLTDPDEAHRIIDGARELSPIAIGPHGPEVLSYELVRTVLRDNRFITAHGLGLDLQGITSGPLWDRAISNILGLDGDVHHRLRRLVSKAFAPRGAERLRTLVIEIINDLVEPLTAAGRCDVVSDIARRYPTPVICALLGAPRRLPRGTDRAPTRIAVRRPDLRAHPHRRRR
jgi:cytochrome P450